MIRQFCVVLLLSVFIIAVAATASVAASAEIDVDDIIYISGSASSEIAAIDSQNDRVFARYALPAPPRLIKVARRLRRLFIVTDEYRDIYAVDIKSGRIVGTKRLDFRIAEIQLSPSGDYLAAGGKNTVSVLRLETLEVVRSFALDASSGNVIFDKTGKVLFAGETRGIRLIEAAMGNPEKAGRIVLGTKKSRTVAIKHFARTPGGTTGIVLDGKGTATVLDLKTSRVARRLTLPGRQEKAYPTNNSQYFLIPNIGDGTVSIVSSWTHRESERLRIGDDVNMLNTALADSVLVAFGTDRATAAVFDLNHRRRLRDISLPGRPAATAMGPSGLKIYVAIPDAARVAVIDVRTLQISGIIKNLGLSPSRLFGSGRLSFCH